MFNYILTTNTLIKGDSLLKKHIRFKTSGSVTSLLTFSFSGMAAGLPGHRGASVAAAAALGLRWGSAPAITPHLATAVESVSARDGRRGEEVTSEFSDQARLLHYKALCVSECACVHSSLYFQAVQWEKAMPTSHSVDCVGTLGSLQCWLWWGGPLQDEKLWERKQLSWMCYGIFALYVKRRE